MPWWEIRMYAEGLSLEFPDPEGPIEETDDLSSLGLTVEEVS